jgi:gliding motility-associated-like protein
LGIAPIIQTTSYIGTNHQIIWVRVENNTTHCFAINSFELLVNPPLLLSTPSPLNICDSTPNDQYAVFDLTVKNNEITQGQTNMTVTYYPSYPITASSIPISNPTMYTNTTPAVQTLGVKVTNAQGCNSYTTLDIRVLPVPVPNAAGITPLPPKCDINNTGDVMEIFDLTLNAAIIINGDTSLTLHYFPSFNDANAGTNEIMTPTVALVGNNVWIRVENNRVDYQGHKCFVLVEQPLTVNPLPALVQPLIIQHCETNMNGQSGFDLTAISVLANGQLASNYNITYYTSANNAQLAISPISVPNSFTNTTNPQTIYIRVVNKLTGCVNYSGKITLNVNPKPSINLPLIMQHPLKVCDTDGINDGMQLYPQNSTSPVGSLAGYINEILGSTQSAPNYIVEYYDNQSFAIAGNTTFALTNLDSYQVKTGRYWIRVTNIVTNCFELKYFDVIVEKLAEPNITAPNNSICVSFGNNTLLNGLTLNSGITNPNYTFTWWLDGTIIPNAIHSTYTINSIATGNYTVIATSKNPPLLGCMSAPSAIFTVQQSGPAQLLNPAFTVSDPFEDNQSITVNVTGYGLYEFSLDDGPYQTSNVFENVSLGSHHITIRDVKGIISCADSIINDIETINYPHYFTPNGDGIHDTWNIIGLEKRPAHIYIFDRYGKLLKQLSPSGEGWDGNYNGNQLPSTDYWFKVEYLDANKWKEFKAHFSLKR